MKDSRQRPALAVGLAASVAVHTAVLAFGAIEIPLAEAPEVRLIRPAAFAPLEPEPDPAPRVVVIRPPGVLPSGGSAGTRGGDASTPGERPPPAGRTVSDAALSTPTPRPSAATTPLALATPLAETGLPALPGVRDSAAVTPDARPARGIILRAGPASSGAGGGRVTGSGGAGGLGGLSAGGGVATVGPGGDCITPGIAGREVPSRGPSALPGRSGGPAVTGRGPAGPSRGRGGRPGG